jgi:hypothetical protein
MRRMGIVGICLAVTLAMSAMAAASASAAPEWKTCVKASKTGKTYNGKYSSKTCSNASFVEGGGQKYELGPFSAAKKTTFTIKGKVGKNYSLNPETGKYVGFTTCKTEKGTGEFTATGATFKVSYSGCESEKKSCLTEGPGEKKGVISDELLSGTLVDLPGGKIGIDIHNKAAPGTTLAKYNCEGLKVDAIGGVIGEVTLGTSEAVKKNKLVFAPNKSGSEEGSLQQWLYPSASVSEAEGYKKTYEWFGNPKLAEPTTLFSVIDEGVYTLPSIQTSISETSGEALKIVG